MASDLSPVEIMYNGVEVFEDLPATSLIASQPVPFVTKSQEPIRYGNYWGQKSIYNIQGQVLGNGPELFAARDSIVDGFKKDFQDFTISDGGDKYVDTKAIVKNINFSESKYNGILDYSITLECYETGLFAGTFGVLDPVDQISYSHTEDERIEITHELSAKGFQTGTQANGSVALDNAKKFVHSRRDDWRAKAKPMFASGEADFEEIEPILLNSSESIDRFEGRYSLTDVFSFSRTGETRVLEKRSISLSSGIVDEAITATINGEIYAGKSGSIDLARDHFKTINHFQLVSEVHPDVDFYHVPIGLDVKEDPLRNTVTYSVNYDNLPVFDTGTQGNTLGAFFDYSVQINTDEMTDIVTASINGTIKGRGNSSDQRKDIQKLYYDLVGTSSEDLSKYLYHQIGIYYSGVENARTPNPSPRSVSVSSGNANGEIQISAEFSDEDFVEGLLSADYSVSVNTAMPIKTTNPSARFEENGYYMIGDMDCGNREKVDIGINLVYDREYYATNIVNKNMSDSLYSHGNQDTLKDMIKNLTTYYTPLTNSTISNTSEDGDKVRLENESYTEDRDSRSLSANYSYSFNGSNFPDQGSNWSDTFLKDAKGRSIIYNRYHKL